MSTNEGFKVQSARRGHSLDTRIFLTTRCLVIPPGISAEHEIIAGLACDVATIACGLAD